MTASVVREPSNNSSSNSNSNSIITVKGNTNKNSSNSNSNSNSNNILSCACLVCIPRAHLLEMFHGSQNPELPTLGTHGQGTSNASKSKIMGHAEHGVRSKLWSVRCGT